MPYCYACRNTKPATHAHFVDHGILALRPPKRHITEIETQWERMSEEEQARAQEQGRQFLAQVETADAQAPRQQTPRSANASRSTGKASARQQEGEGSPWGLLAVGALFLSGIGWVIFKGTRGA